MPPLRNLNVFILILCIVVVVKNCHDETLKKRSLLLSSVENQEITRKSKSSIIRDANTFFSPTHSATANNKNQLAWLLHFHKAGGTSFTDLAAKNYEKKLASKRDHSHLELNYENGKEFFRWDLVQDAHEKTNTRLHTRNDRIPDSCAKRRDHTIDIMKNLEEVTEDGITFISTEHWFPPMEVGTRSSIIPPNVKLIVVFREPLSRLLSSYYFHECGGNRCRNDDIRARCRFSEWHRVEDNLYTRMLNGHPFSPQRLGKKCTEDYASIPLRRAHFYTALDTIRQFDLILTLESISRRPEETSCALERVLGWKETIMPHQNTNSIRECPVEAREKIPSNPEQWEIDDATENNVWDFELYEHAKGLEDEMLWKLGCIGG